MTSVTIHWLHTDANTSFGEVDINEWCPWALQQQNQANVDQVAVHHAERVQLIPLVQRKSLGGRPQACPSYRDNVYRLGNIGIIFTVQNWWCLVF